MQRAMTTSVVIPTCPPPNPSNLARMPQSILGSSSRPTRKSIITTPNSAKCWMAMTSTPSTARIGLITIPAMRYPKTDPSPRRDAIGTATTPAHKKIKARRRKSVMSQTFKSVLDLRVSLSICERQVQRHFSIGLGAGCDSAYVGCSELRKTRTAWPSQRTIRTTR